MKLERKVRAVWALAPDVGCKGLCSAYCGIIPLDDAERIVYAEHAITIGHLADGTCDKLVLGRCSIYEDRPLICRLWGGVDEMHSWLRPDDAHRRGVLDLQGNARTGGGPTMMEARHEWWAVEMSTAAANGGFPRVSPSAIDACFTYIEQLEGEAGEMWGEMFDPALTVSDVEDMLGEPDVAVALAEWLKAQTKIEPSVETIEPKGSYL